MLSFQTPLICSSTVARPTSSPHLTSPHLTAVLSSICSTAASSLVPKTIGNTCSFNTHKLVTSFQKSFVFSLKFWILSSSPLVSPSPCLTNPPLLFISPLFLLYTRTCIHSLTPSSDFLFFSFIFFLF